MYTLAALLVVLALLAWQVKAAPTGKASEVIVVRRVYETRVVETIIGPSRRGSSVTQSVSSSGSASALPVPATTRSSHGSSG
jgi:hypothetical protein